MGGVGSAGGSRGPVSRGGAGSKPGCACRSSCRLVSGPSGLGPRSAEGPRPRSSNELAPSSASGCERGSAGRGGDAGSGCSAKHGGVGPAHRHSTCREAGFGPRYPGGCSRAGQLHRGLWGCRWGCQFGRFGCCGDWGCRRGAARGSDTLGCCAVRGSREAGGLCGCSGVSRGSRRVGLSLGSLKGIPTAPSAPGSVPGPSTRS